MQHTYYAAESPILTGPAAQAAARRSWEAVHSLLTQLATNELSSCARVSLTVYHCCVYHVFGHSADAVRAQQLIQQLAVLPWPAGQFWSATQLDQACALAWLQTNGAAVGLPEAGLLAQLSIFDDLLNQYAHSLLARPGLDSRWQLVRIARYLALRHPAPTACRHHAALLAAWPALPAGQALDLGLADGLAGELLRLIRACRAIGLTAAPELLVRQGLRYLLAGRRNTDFLAHHYSIFPDQFRSEPLASTFSEELSWSRGDAGQALLLYEAQALLHDTELLKIAELVGLNTTLRSSLAATSVSHAGFYHGASGVAQLYARLYQTSGHPTYQAAYQHWLGRTQHLLWPEWPALVRPAPLPDEPGLFGGLTGIGLVLLSACHDAGLNWEDILG